MICCESCPNNNNCTNCLSLIDGGDLRKKLSPPITVKLTSVEQGDVFYGDLSVISPVGMLIKTNAPFDEYKISIRKNIETVISPVFKKGLEDFIAFDIIRVTRASGADKRLTKEEYEFLTMNKSDLIDHLTEDIEDNIKDEIREDLKNELLKSELLDQLVAGSTFKYDKGRIRQISGGKDELLKEDHMIELMNESFRKSQPQRDTIIDTDNERYVDIHALPLGYQSGGFITFDVTDIVRKEKELLQEQWENYKEVISAITKGKICLKNKSELTQLLDDYSNEKEHEVSSIDHLASLREMVTELLTYFEIPSKIQKHVVLAVHEAATNVLKYAEYGTVSAWSNDETLLFLIKDFGRGIQLKDLPKATLITGFSEASTLGQGFNLMTKLVDRVYLKSDSTGTTVGLLVKRHKSE